MVAASLKISNILGRMHGEEKEVQQVALGTANGDDGERHSKVEVEVPPSQRYSPYTFTDQPEDYPVHTLFKHSMFSYILLISIITVNNSTKI